jgi:uncharacterized protein (TIGR00251 family)
MVSRHQFKDGKTGSAITVRISPRSSRNEISEIMDEGLIKIRLKAPPIEGQANKALVRFLSSVLDIPPSRIEIVGGQKSRTKLVTITGLDPQELQNRISAHLAS